MEYRDGETPRISNLLRSKGRVSAPPCAQAPGCHGAEAPGSVHDSIARAVSEQRGPPSQQWSGSWTCHNNCDWPTDSRTLWSSNETSYSCSLQASHFSTSVAWPFKPTLEVSEMQVKVEARLTQPSSKNELKVHGFLFGETAIIGQRHMRGSLLMKKHHMPQVARTTPRVLMGLCLPPSAHVPWICFSSIQSPM